MTSLFSLLFCGDIKLNMLLAFDLKVGVPKEEEKTTKSKKRMIQTWILVVVIIICLKSIFDSQVNAMSKDILFIEYIL